MNHKSPCQICREPVADMSKRFIPSLGFGCAECAGFLESIERPLRKAGIDGVAIPAVRYTPNPAPKKP